MANNYSITRFIIHVFPILLGLCISFVGAASIFGHLSPIPSQLYFSAYGGRYSNFASLHINRRLLAPLSANLIDQTFYHYGWDVNDQQIVVSVLVEDKVLLTLFDLQERSY